MKKTFNHPQTIIGIDLGDKKHAVCVLDKDGKVICEKSITNQRKPLEALCKDYPAARVAIEVGTHSPWISRLLTEGGMEVIVANARKLRAIYQNERKSDELDARMLAKIARLDPEMLHPVTHRGEESQRDLLLIKLRDNLVRQRVNMINGVRGALKSLGIKLSLTTTQASVRRAREELVEHKGLEAVIEPLLVVLEILNQQIAQYDGMIAKAVEERCPQAGKLRVIGGVGPITALCFVLSIEDPGRFEDARDVGAYLGLVPRRDQSGNTDKQLPISKAGNGYLRRLLVQCAQHVMGPFGADSDLRRQGLKLAERGGKAAKKRATIAVARKLAVLMLTLWQKQAEYEPLRNAAQMEVKAKSQGLAAA
jgi:transposase